MLTLTANLPRFIIYSKVTILDDVLACYLLAQHSSYLKQDGMPLFYTDLTVMFLLLTYHSWINTTLTL